MGQMDGRVGVVTGGASGIGRALAIELAVRGASVAISDVDVNGLAETAEMVRRQGATVIAEVVDVSDETAMLEHADDVVDQLGRVDIVINNAGVNLAGSAMDDAIDDLKWVFGIDFFGVVNGCQAFLPALIASGDGHLVNLSSILGFMGAPMQSGYSAAKFAVRGYSESLAMDLEAAGHPVRVTCVHPGGVKTNLARTARITAEDARFDLIDTFEKVAFTTPERAARLIVSGALKGRRRVLIGADARAARIMERVLGSAYQPLVAKMAARALND